MSTTAVRAGETLQRRRTGIERTIVGFTTKPTPSAPSDGVRRARLVSLDNGSETRVRVDQLFKSYVRP